MIRILKNKQNNCFPCIKSHLKSNIFNKITFFQFSNVDHLKIENIRLKFLSNTSFAHSSRDRTRGINFRVYENTIDKLFLINNKDKIIETVLPESLKILRLFRKRRYSKNNNLLPICIKIFNTLKGAEFPLILIPYFLSYADVLGESSQSQLKLLPKSFIGDFETSFYQQAVILNLNELVQMSIMPKYFDVDSKFLAFLENNILHKLEHIEKNSEFSEIISLTALNFLHLCSINFLTKFLTKSSDLINENSIGFPDLSTLLFSLRRHGDKIGENKTLIIDSFLFRIRDFLFEIPKDHINFNVNLLMLIVFRRFKFDITKNGVNLGNVLIKSILHKTNLIPHKKLFQIIKCSVFYRKELEIDQSTINKLSMIALSNFHKVTSAEDLLKYINFYMRMNIQNKEKIIYILKLKLTEILLKKDQNSLNLDRCIKIIEPKSVLFDIVYSKYKRDIEKLESVREPRFYKKQAVVEEKEDLTSEGESDSEDLKNN